jgi:PTS system fructose-specific IIC component
MKLIAVTSSPGSEPHARMAAASLSREATLLGHELVSEVHGTEAVLAASTIADAHALIVAADTPFDTARFAALPVYATSTAEAIRRPRGAITAALALTGEPGSDPQPTSVATAATTATRRLVAVTSCPTGIAHTFMAAEGLKRAAEELGYDIKVETQGSVGAGNTLTADDVQDADAVIIAADTKVDLGRFVGKPVYETSTNQALKNGADVIRNALGDAPVLRSANGDGSGGVGAGAGTGGGGDDGREGMGSMLKGVYQHLMTGVSHMLPFIVAGGLLIALSFAFDIDANQAEMADTFAGRLNQIGSAALTLFLPVLAGYIAYSIADRPGLAPGFIGGYLAVEVESGFLGALAAGFVAGLLTRELARRINLPTTLAGLKPILILPLLSSLIVGLAVFYVIGEPIAWLQDQLTSGLEDLQGSNAALLGLVLGAMMASDMGGPFNKVAYTFAVGLIDSGVTAPMAAVMAAGMTPPLGLALATVLFKDRWTHDEREAGKPAFVLGLSFITEGAIPFAARDPLHVIPALVVGSAAAGAISLGFDASTVVPHGGVFNLFVPNAMENVGAWVLAIVVGALVTTASLLVIKRPVSVAEQVLEDQAELAHA